MANEHSATLTVGEALQKSAGFLAAKGVESSRLSAEILLAHVLSTDRLHVYLRFEEQLDADAVTRLRELIVRRSQGEPVAYLIGYREFMGLKFEVSPAVLIPRPDTELLVKLVGKEISSSGKEPTILDLGCGSGCIGISLLMQCPQAHLLAVDISPEALEICRRNAEFHKVTDRVNFIEGPLFNSVPQEYRGKLDWIVSNPPYIRDAEWSALAVEIVKYEPRIALAAGPEGLDLYRPLIAEAPQWLKPGGRLALEISPAVVDSVTQLLISEGLGEIGVHSDLGNNPRVITAGKCEK